MRDTRKDIIGNAMVPGAINFFFYQLFFWFKLVAERAIAGN